MIVHYTPSTNEESSENVLYTLRQKYTGAARRSLQQFGNKKSGERNLDLRENSQKVLNKEGYDLHERVVLKATFSAARITLRDNFMKGKQY